MTRYSVAAAAILVATAIYAADTQPSATNNAPAAFVKLKSLAGEWEADTDMGKVHLSYELIAAGTALVEREKSDHMPEMMTVYHLDGGRLMMTHYCMAGNQPRMQAQPFHAASNEVQFRFLDATNLTTPAAGHIHGGLLRFVDDSHLISEWQFYENGQLKRTETSTFTRIH